MNHIKCININFHNIIIHYFIKNLNKNFCLNRIFQYFYYFIVIFNKNTRLIHLVFYVDNNMKDGIIVMYGSEVRVMEIQVFVKGKKEPITYKGDRIDVLDLTLQGIEYKQIRCFKKGFSKSELIQDDLIVKIN